MPPPPSTAGRSNAILASLPPDVAALLEPELVSVQLATKQVIYAIGEPIRAVYFPLTCVISLLTMLEDGSTVEAAMVGNDGMAGLPVALGLESDGLYVINQIPGTALMMPVGAFRAALAAADGRLLAEVHRATQALIIQMGQTAACNRLHPLEERCARWLLGCHDRVGAEQFQLTQEFLASMLGVRRPSVSVAAGMLQQAGFIRYQRGRVTIADREGMEASACECYAAIRNATANLLPTARPWSSRTLLNECYARNGFVGLLAYRRRFAAQLLWQ